VRRGGGQGLQRRGSPVKAIADGGSYNHRDSHSNSDNHSHSHSRRDSGLVLLDSASSGPHDFQDEPQHSDSTANLREEVSSVRPHG